MSLTRYQHLTIMLCLLAVLSASAAGQTSSGGLNVINHVFTSHVIQGEDGSLSPGDLLIGFERGTASFHTITQIVLKAGTYNIRMELKDPSGKVIAAQTLPPIQAQHDEWSQALWVQWPNIPFHQTGRYELAVILGNQVVARFHLTVS